MAYSLHWRNIGYRIHLIVYKINAWRKGSSSLNVLIPFLIVYSNSGKVIRRFFFCFISWNICTTSGLRVALPRAGRPSKCSTSGKVNWAISSLPIKNASSSDLYRSAIHLHKFQRILTEGMRRRHPRPTASMAFLSASPKTPIIFTN